MTFTNAYMTNKNVMDHATEISYDIDSETLRFWIAEGCVLECTFTRNVSGTSEQLYGFYKNELRNMFPNCRLMIKVNREYVSAN